MAGPVVSAGPVAATKAASVPVKTNIAWQSVEASDSGIFIIYGDPGVGKSTLAFGAPAPVGFIDVDDSLPVLKAGGNYIPDSVRRIPPPQSYEELLSFLGDWAVWEGIKTVCIDTFGSRIDELIKAYVVQSHNAGSTKKVAALDEIPHGRGYAGLYDAYDKLIPLLEGHKRRGRIVLLLAHNVKENTKNTAGEDYPRCAPDIRVGSDKNQIRNRFLGIADNIFFIGHDISVDDGKVKGGNSRTVFTQATAWYVNKVRCGIETNWGLDRLTDKPQSGDAVAFWKHIQKGSAA